MNPSNTGAAVPPWLEQAWLHAYLDGELGPDEREWFEIYMLDKPHMVTAVDADSRLREVLAADPGLPRGPKAARPVARTERNRWLRPVLGLAWAASVLSSIGLGAWMMNRGSGTSDEVFSPPRVVFDTLRGELAGAHEEAGDPASPVRLYELPLPPGAEVVSARAEHAGRLTLLPWAPASTDGYLTYALPVDWRGQGSLRLVLRFPDQPGDPIELEFPL